MMRNVLSVVILGLLCSASFAQQNPAIKHTAAAYIEPATLLLAEIDTEKLDVRAASSWLDQNAGVPISDSTMEALSRLVDSLRKSGDRRLFVVASAASLIEGGPVVVIPCTNPVAIGKLVSTVVLRSSWNHLKVKVGDQVVLVGPDAALQRIAKSKGIEKSDLILPPSDREHLDHLLVISLPDEVRRLLSTIWPERMPEGSPVQFSPRRLIQDISRVVVSLCLLPQEELVADIETVDSNAAKRVKVVVDQIIKFSSVNPAAVDSKIDGSTLSLRTDLETFATVAKEILAPALERAAQLQTMNSMKLLGVAIHNYCAASKRLPPRYFVDQQGNRLYSWRVALLPYLEQKALYKLIKLDQPWDSKSNQRMTSTVISVLSQVSGDRIKTRMRAPVYPGSLWHGDGPPKTFQDVNDGLSNTIALIHAPESAAIEWANPEPWVISTDDPMGDVFRDRESAVVMLLDGSARVLKKAEMTKEKLHALLTIDGRETIDW